MSMRFVCLALLAALVAGCATRLPDTTFAKPAALERAMNRYYEAHATEQWGYCLTPYIDGLTQVAVVDEQAERLVVDVRYLYRDRRKGSDQNSFATECVSYAGRQFTFGKGPGGELKVLDMTGPRRS
jgi:hypothetical protein